MKLNLLLAKLLPAFVFSAVCAFAQYDGQVLDVESVQVGSYQRYYVNNTGSEVAVHIYFEDWTYEMNGPGWSLAGANFQTFNLNPGDGFLTYVAGPNGVPGGSYIATDGLGIQYWRKANVTSQTNETWTPFDEPQGWNWTAWTPDESSVTYGQAFTQTRDGSQYHRTGERNQHGTERNVGGYWENASESRTSYGNADVWTPFDEPQGWNWTAWAPDPATIPAGQSFTQTRNGSQYHRTGERNQHGAERNVGGYWEYDTQNRNQSGTQLIATTFTFGNLAHVYSGSTVAATVTANPSSATFTTDLVRGPNVGSYTVTASATGNYTGSGSATLQITQASQTIALTPGSQTISATQSITFNVSGGLTGYVWGGYATGSGSSKALNFPSPGSFTVNVYAPSSTNYYQSNTASVTITVNKAPQTISISPSTATIATGQAISFTASGGQGIGAYVWGGSATGNGTTQSVTFTTPGAHTVTVYNAGDAVYAQSNTAVASINVTNSAPSASLTPSATSATVGDVITLTVGSADVDGNLQTLVCDLSNDGISWTSGATNWSGATSWAVTGASASRTITFTPSTAGTYYFRARAVDAAGSASSYATASVTVATPTPPSIRVKPESPAVKVQKNDTRGAGQIIISGP